MGTKIDHKPYSYKSEQILWQNKGLFVYKTIFGSLFDFAGELGQIPDKRGLNR